MNRRELTKYHSELAGILNSEPDRSKWKEFLEHERTTKQYKLAKEHVRTWVSSSPIKPILPPVVGELPNEAKTEELVDVMLTIVWSKGVQKEHNNLLKGNGAHRKRAWNLVTQTAERLLENPQDINIAERAWRTNGAEQDGAQEPKEPFSKIVKEKMFKLIKDEWVSVTPDQLAGLVRIYANKDESQESARESAEGLLRNYFKGPENRNQRIGAYYNFVSGVFDLAEEDEAFKEGVKIALHATDVFPKNPSLAEQTALLNFPYNVGKKVFQDLLVARRVIAWVCFMDRQNLGKYYQDRVDFMNKDSEVIEESNKRREWMIEQVGFNRTSEMYNVMRTTMSIIADPSAKPSFVDESEMTIGAVDPLKLAFDENHPLNQKFNRILADQTARSSQATS